MTNFVKLVSGAGFGLGFPIIPKVGNTVAKAVELVQKTANKAFQAIDKALGNIGYVNITYFNPWTKLCLSLGRLPNS